MHASANIPPIPAKFPSYNSIEQLDASKEEACTNRQVLGTNLKLRLCCKP